MAEELDSADYKISPSGRKVRARKIVLVKKDDQQESVKKFSDLTSEIAYVTETFRAGAMKLKDGSTVRLSSADVDLLNNLREALSSENADKMFAKAMSSKTEFDRVMSFAKKTLGEEVELDEAKEYTYHVTKNAIGKESHKYIDPKRKSFPAEHLAATFIRSQNGRKSGTIHKVDPDTGKIVQARSIADGQAGYARTPEHDDPKHVKDLREDVGLDETNGVKGWKHAGRDIAKWRSEQGKNVKLVALKKDGTESKMYDATKTFKSEDEAHAHHKRIVDLNPKMKIRHNLYVDGNHVKTLGE